MIDVVIPTKSNVHGLTRLLGQLSADAGIEHIFVVADGDKAIEMVASIEKPSNVVTTHVELGMGIHVMWNLGMDLSTRGNHICFVNDDVSIAANCMSVMAEVLGRNPEIGLLAPNATGVVLPEFSQSSGFAGFCMMLASDLCPQFRFDERMKWWYGDNDIITWVNSIGRQTGFTGLTTCSENQSYTINHDPPENFQQLIQEDARIFGEKWGR